MIERSPEFGMPPLVARRGLDATTITAIRRILTGGQAARKGAVTGFYVPADSAYDFIRQLGGSPAQPRTASSTANGG